ncbi:response regulator receiver domain protein [Synechococcus sp. PCC 7335]|uniref:response regulator n=1 Tax=Synechococcus sp. (strain ATCC 29403 / PCC 7335) TaxID=91464 RepID=UPI00017EB8A6|nr:response regulator transcription factor [Synechococcus sp. PCC 7335]EDX85545.1 response regulator receiver domain protein [Synechococcus sp. PCC 7335]
MSAEPTIKVLVVEDHSVVREGIVSVLNRQENITVVAEAKNGKEAIALHADHQPDITLMDLRMPQIEGLEAVIQIRTASPQARIIILTTYDTDEDIYQCLQAGARGYLLKDATSQELTQAVRQVYQGKRFIPADVAMKLAERIESDELTAREIDVLEMMVQGSSTAKLSEALHISEGTVKFHVNNILQKLNAHDRTQAVVTALHRGIVRLKRD